MAVLGSIGAGQSQDEFVETFGGIDEIETSAFLQSQITEGRIVLLEQWIVAVTVKFATETGFAFRHHVAIDAAVVGDAANACLETGDIQPCMREMRLLIQEQIGENNGLFRRRWRLEIVVQRVKSILQKKLEEELRRDGRYNVL